MKQAAPAYVNKFVPIIHPRTLLLCAALLACLSVSAAAGDTLDTLRAEHPRVLATADDFTRIKGLVKTDDHAKQWHAEMKLKAADMLDQPVVSYRLRDGRRLLYESRVVLGRVLTLAMLDQIEPDDRYRDRVWADMKAAAEFKHWNPNHFLDVAEMGLAFAIAYDWMHDRWTDEQRAVMREAMIKHAIEPGLSAHERGVWWTRTKINWNQVCHGGLIAASLAIADDEPALAQKMVGLAVKALQVPMAQYAPDGGYEEGPGYWSYGTLYNVIAIAALDSALGKDFGLSDSPGFGKTAAFPIQMIGTSGKFFNFGDNRERVSASPALFWFARRFYKNPIADFYQAPISAKFMLGKVRASSLALLWYDPNIDDVQYAPDLKAVYKTAGVAVMRSGWGSDATFIGAKAGRIGFGHSQMDLGSFVLDSDGVRWFIDLGADDYNLPGYFESNKGAKRWAYYRNRAEGHNTLVINPDQSGGQNYDVHADVHADLWTKDHKSDWSIKVDLSKAYLNADVQRHFAHFPGSNDYTVITDTIKLDEPGEVWWFAHTRAAITLAEDGRSATLRQDGQTLHVKIVRPKDAAFTVMDARPLPTSPDPEGQNPNNGSEKINGAKGAHHVKRGTLPAYGKPDPKTAVRKLAIKLEGVKDTSIVIEFAAPKPGA